MGGQERARCPEQGSRVGTQGWTHLPGAETGLLLGEDLTVVPEVSLGSGHLQGRILKPVL